MAPDSRWLLPLCQLQRRLATGADKQELAGLACEVLHLVSGASVTAIWLWEPPASLVMQLGQGQERLRGCIRTALLRAGRAVGHRGPLHVRPQVAIDPDSSPSSTLKPMVSWPILSPDGPVGVVLLAGASLDPEAPLPGAVREVVLEGLGTAVQARPVYPPATVQAASALAEAVDAKDHYTHYHSRVVSRLAEIVAKRMGLPPGEVALIKMAGLLHDLGKIGIPDAILNKPGPLDALETLQMEQHPVMGQRIIETISDLRNIAATVRAHHERWDGQGYPDRLRGEAIPLSARIVTVVDSYDAMTSDRIYRPGRSIDAAADELVKHRGSQFDPAVVDVMVAFVRERARVMQAEDQADNPIHNRAS